MKKHGFLLALAVFAQGAMANKVGSSYSNVEVLVAETGASSSWVTKGMIVAEQNAQKLERTLEEANAKLATKMEQRINLMLEASVQQ